MLKRLLKKLVEGVQTKQLARENLLRKRNNRNQINLILKDIEERAI